ncbi:MAG: hypothetical protein AAGA80_02240 [Cyanobacteria bacterium P01_F01_bin.143]
MSEPILFLPQLKANADVMPLNAPGEWQVQSDKVLYNVASSLSYEFPGAFRNISLVPNMWARPLITEMILYDDQNSFREQMIPAWQGMLAMIALAEIRDFPLTAKLLELGKLRYEENFARCLFELLPDYKGRNLYTLDNKHPWEDIYLFLWDKKPIGMTSPTTIVVPTERGNWQDLPWWDDNEKRFKSPHKFLNKDEKALLWSWLDNLTKTLTKYKKKANKERGDETAIDIMRGLLTYYQSSLTRIDEQRLILSDDPIFFGLHINRGVLEALNRPLKILDKESSVRLIPSREKDKNGNPPLLIYDPEMPRVWNEKPQNIWIHGGKTLASLKREDCSKFKELWTEVNLVRPDELFLPELKFIELENAFPGALSPKVDQPLVFDDQRITPLIPLNPILLDYFTPEDLLSKIKFQQLRIREGISRIRLVLDLPLSGVREDLAPENYRLFKDYDLKAENSLGDQLPVLQIWPNFQKKDWREYYIFYGDEELAEYTFKIACPQAKRVNSFKEGFGNFLISAIEDFPEYLPCTDFYNQPIGLILLKSPKEIKAHNHWQVGLDFNSSFTNVYIRVNNQNLTHPLESKNLQLQVTNSWESNRINTLFEYFIPETFKPAFNQKSFPIQSCLTTRGKNSNSTKMLPILDGRIYVPNYDRFEAKKDWVKNDLNWAFDNHEYTEIFLKHLALHISALAAEAGVDEIQWSLSYPSALSRSYILTYSDAWANAAKELEASTGIKQKFLDIRSKHFRPESLAFAQYFADLKNEDFSYATCIYIKDDVSDISIWKDNNLVHQCSVKLAGQDIFSQAIRLNPKFAEEQFGFKPSEWKCLDRNNFSVKLNRWLRYSSQKWLVDSKVLQKEDQDFQEEFQELTRLIAIGIAGIYYYIGILLKVLYEEKKIDQEKIPTIYIGGSASQVLDWLDPRGKFDHNSEIYELFSRMLSVASGFEDIKEITRLSLYPQDEIACALALNKTKLKRKGLIKKLMKKTIISGESCIINGEKLASHQRLSLSDIDDDITEFNIPNLVEIPKFIHQFHQAIKDLKLDQISVLEGYNPSLAIEDNSRLFQDTRRELDNMLLDIKGDSKNIRLESGFILGLKALLKVLGKQWTRR